MITVLTYILKVHFEKNLNLKYFYQKTSIIIQRIWLIKIYCLKKNRNRISVTTIHNRTHKALTHYTYVRRSQNFFIRFRIFAFPRSGDSCCFCAVPFFRIISFPVPFCLRAVLLFSLFRFVVLLSCELFKRRFEFNAIYSGFRRGRRRVLAKFGLYWERTGFTRGRREKNILRHFVLRPGYFFNNYLGFVNKKRNVKVFEG